MANRSYRLLLAAPGATATPASSDADYILDTQLAEAPSVLGPIVRPLQGRTEARPWSVTAVDQSTFITSRLADSSGRMDTLGRIAAVQSQTDGGAWSNLGVGRVSDVFLEDVAAYRFTMEDERMLERRATIFNTSNTTRLFPGGPHVNYGAWQPPAKGQGFIASTSFGKVTGFIFDNNYPYMPSAVIDAIENDMVVNPIVSTASTVGNFDNVVLTVGGSTYPVVSFTGTLEAGEVIPTPSDQIMRGLESDPERQHGYIVWAASTDFERGDSFSSAYLHMMGAEPSPATPLHIGGADGIPPATLAMNVLQGNFSSSGTLLPRLSTAAIDTLLEEPIMPVRLRVTKSANMAQFLEDEVYQQAGIVPFVDSSGVLAPKTVWLPATSSGVTFTFDKTNLAEPPEWAHVIRELVTGINFTYPVEREFDTEIRGRIPLPGRGEAVRFLTPETDGADLIGVDEKEGTVRNDRYATLGPYEITMPLNGYPLQLPGLANWIHGIVNKLDGIPNYSKKMIDRIKTETFARYGDGPIQGSMVALSTAEGVEPGDFVKIDLETYPNPKTGTRGGVRIVQVLSRDLTPAGPNFTYLDAGPNVQPFDAPAITLSTVAADPKHSLTATIAGLSSQSTVAEFQLQMANSATAPASGSTLWREQPTTANSSGAYRISGLPSDSTFQARARIIQPGQRNPFKSLWTNASAKATAAISPPTSLTASNLGVMDWTIGDAREPLDVHTDTVTTAAAGSSNRVARLGSGGTRYQIEGLSSGVEYFCAVRHADNYGGFSAADSTTFTLAAIPTAPSMAGIEIVSAG